ncbi:MAG: lipoyl synthase [Candidatus Competibacter sp.]|nr:lipoyl synthase [Candidatus Competibacteraceae bacterium]
MSESSLSPEFVAPAADALASAPPAKAVQAPGGKLRGEEKLARIPVKIAPTTPEQRLRKPAWIRARFPGTPEVLRLKQILRDNRLHTVCEEANCPNLGECFGHGTATFMIMGDICTRRCPFCDVGHGRPNPLDGQEPENLARTVAAMGLNYVVITSVDRDDLRDGGAAHFAACVRAVRARRPGIVIEILTPDFRGRMEAALAVLAGEPPDVFNHNLETVPRLYRQARPGADYHYSLQLLKRFKEAHPRIPTKSGLMLGLGETLAEIEEVMGDLRDHGVNMLTLGQYLQPSVHHLPVACYVPPEEFERLRAVGEALGFTHVASGPMVRSSYHADSQARGAGVASAP